MDTVARKSLGQGHRTDQERARVNGRRLDTGTVRPGQVFAEAMEVHDAVPGSHNGRGATACPFSATIGIPRAEDRAIFSPRLLTLTSRSSFCRNRDLPRLPRGVYSL